LPEYVSEAFKAAGAAIITMKRYFLKNLSKALGARLGLLTGNVVG